MYPLRWLPKASILIWMELTDAAFKNPCFLTGHAKTEQQSLGSLYLESDIPYWNVPLPDSFCFHMTALIFSIWDQKPWQYPANTHPLGCLLNQLSIALHRTSSLEHVVSGCKLQTQSSEAKPPIPPHSHAVYVGSPCVTWAMLITIPMWTERC